MPRGFNIRLAAGDPPRLRPYRYGQRTTGTRLTAARIGATVQWNRGVMELGGWLAAALVQTLLQTAAENIVEAAPVGPDPPDHPAWSGHVHMRDSVNISMNIKGKGDVIDHPSATSRSHAYGEVFVGFPWRFLEYGTVKMPARPFVEPAYEAAMAEYASIIAELKGKFGGGGLAIGQRSPTAFGQGSLGGIV